MKIRIVQHGFESFSGLLGDVRFEDGLSVSEVNAQQADYVRAMFVTEIVEVAEGEQAAADEAVEVEQPAAEQAVEVEQVEQAAAEQDAQAEVATPDAEATEQVSE
jgi:hypothetical protein